MEEAETCINCPEDVPVCDPGGEEICGDGKVGKKEDCKNCEEDVKECIPTCGDGKYQE